MGYRQQAIHMWMNDYATTSDSGSLKRLFWALEQSGAHMEKTALKRFIAGKYPGVAGVLSRRDRDYDPSKLETISGLWVEEGIEGEK